MNIEPTQWLESIIDSYADEPEPLESFILPGGPHLLQIFMFVEQ